MRHIQGVSFTPKKLHWAFVWMPDAAYKTENYHRRLSASEFYLQWRHHTTLGGGARTQKCFAFLIGYLWEVQTRWTGQKTTLGTRGRCRHAQKHLFLQILSRHMFFFVFLNFKRGFFSWTFWFGASFICKNAYSCLHSGFTWWSRAKYIEWSKKYVKALNMWF